jgi:glutamate synthase (NADPH/NADH) small chain
MPPDVERNPVWPYWPTRLRTSSSHEEGVNRDWSIATKEFIGEHGAVKALKTVKLEWKDGKPAEIPGSEAVIPADLVLLAMGFVSPLQSMLEEFGVQKDARGNARAGVENSTSGLAYATSVSKVFAAGDVRRGQSLVVWAIREGRQCARAVDEFLMGFSELPR